MTFILSGKTSDFVTGHNSVMLDQAKEYEAALLSLDTYNSIPNIIEEKNNIFKYYNGATWKIIALKTGAYELTAINNDLRRQMIANGDSNRNGDSTFSITANISRSTSIVNIKNLNYKIDFGVENSIGTILGFGATVIGYGYNESTHIVDIMPTNSILVNIDIINGSYVNGSPSPSIYSFYPNVAPGYKIVERPNPSLIYCPVSRNDISRMRVWFTDQDGNLVDFRGERITIKICIREVKSRSAESEILKAVSEIKN